MEGKKIRNCKCKGYSDIHVNPDKPGESRIPIDTCNENLLNFLSNELVLAEACSCPSCQFRAIMLYKLEAMVKENNELKRKVKAIHHFINNH